MAYKEGRKEYDRKYRQTKKYKAYVRAYVKTKKAKETRSRYMKTEKQKKWRLCNYLKNREKLIKKAKEYREANILKVRICAKKRYLKNREKILARRRREDFRERHRIEQRKWRANNREKVISSKRQYYKKYPEKQIARTALLRLGIKMKNREGVVREYLKAMEMLYKLKMEVKNGR